MRHWARHGIAVRRSVLLLMGGLLLAAGFASERNPWNFRVFETTIGHPVTLVSLATIVLGLELSLTFRSFLVWTLAGGAACCAFVMLCAALVLSLFQTAPHVHGRTVATSPDGHVTLIVTEGGALSLSWRHRVYLRTSEGLDREVLIATGCLRNVSADVRFVGNRAVELRDWNGEFQRVEFDRNLNADARARLYCEPVDSD